MWRWIPLFLLDNDSPFRSVIYESLNANLADDWSQVHMSGSVLCRTFVTALLTIYKEQTTTRSPISEEEDVTVFESAVGDDMVSMLLPRMCLNWFYLAQGVKLYSQETWNLEDTDQITINRVGCIIMREYYLRV